MAYVDTCLLSLLTLRTIFGVLIDTSERLEMLLSRKNKYLFAVNIVYLGLNGQHYLFAQQPKRKHLVAISGHMHSNFAFKLCHHLS